MPCRFLSLSWVERLLGEEKAKSLPTPVIARRQLLPSAAPGTHHSQTATQVWTAVTCPQLSPGVNWQLWPVPTACRPSHQWSLILLHLGLQAALFQWLLQNSKVSVPAEIPAVPFGIGSPEGKHSMPQELKPLWGQWPAQWCDHSEWLVTHMPGHTSWLPIK